MYKICIKIIFYFTFYGIIYPNLFFSEIAVNTLIFLWFGVLMLIDLDDFKNKAVISAIIHLAKSLGFQIVSEGIETKEQADFAREQGSDQAQGYYFYKPMPAEEFEKLLEADVNG